MLIAFLFLSRLLVASLLPFLMLCCDNITFLSKLYMLSRLRDTVFQVVRLTEKSRLKATLLFYLP